MRVCPTCGEVYSASADCCPADGSVCTDIDAFATTDRQHGRVLGNRYRLDRSLGVGGYGAVFAAVDLHSGEAVAIKVLSPAVERSPELLTRFHREAIAASRVRHPSIVDVVDFDVDDDGTQYIVMEFLDGHDLAQRLEDSDRLPPAAALAIAAQCARGLAAAHRAGVLHRDLKPSNVFLVRQHDGAERVKVIDFGISKLTRTAGDYTDVTRGSQVVGTPRYMSPEQARGEELDGRTDIYALGVMLFEMLVGAPPFVGRSPLELFAQHVRAPRQPPSARVPELAACPGLDALVVRALAADRGARFATMDDLADALVACLRAIAPEAADELGECSGEITGPRLASPPRRSWVTRAYVPALLTIAAAAVLAGVLVSSRPAPEAAPTAPAPALAPEVASEVAADLTAEVTANVPVPAEVPAEVAETRVDAGVPATARESSHEPAMTRGELDPPAGAPAVKRRKARSAAELGVAEW